MSKLPAPTTAPRTPNPPRKALRRPDLSFEALASIDFFSLLDQVPSAVHPARPGDSGQPVPSLDDAPHPPSSDAPIAWSFDPPFFSINEAAAWLSVSLATMKRLLSQGALPFIRGGARRKIPLSALRTYVICNRAGCPMPPPNAPNNSMAFNT